MTPENKKKYLVPGSIWERKKNGKKESVYVESLKSNLINDGNGFIDFRTEFGLETIRKEKFLALFEYKGEAKIRLNEIASDKNLIPFLGDLLKW